MGGAAHVAGPHQPQGLDPALAAECEVRLPHLNRGREEGGEAEQLEHAGCEEGGGGHTSRQQGEWG